MCLLCQDIPKSCGQLSSSNSSNVKEPSSKLLKMGFSGIHIGDCNRGCGGGYLEFRLWLNRVASKAHSARSGLRILGAQRPPEESQGFQQAVSFKFPSTFGVPLSVPS